MLSVLCPSAEVGKGEYSDLDVNLFWKREQYRGTGREVWVRTAREQVFSVQHLSRWGVGAAVSLEQLCSSSLAPPMFFSLFRFLSVQHPSRWSSRLAPPMFFSLETFSVERAVSLCGVSFICGEDSFLCRSGRGRETGTHSDPDVN